MCYTFRIQGEVIDLLHSAYLVEYIYVYFLESDGVPETG